MSTDNFSNPEIGSGRTEPDIGSGFAGHDELEPKGAAGHAYAIDVSTRLTSYFRETHRKHAMDVTPKQVMDCLRHAGVKDWVLMGLHGYVGYLSTPRATQDVDVMVPYSQKDRAIRAISDRWPELEMTELSQVVRFKDAGDLDLEGRPKPVIDLMLPWGPFQRMILEKHVLVDGETGDRIPTIEAAIASKYAAVLSPYRELGKKSYDAGDLRQIIRSNHEKIDEQALQELTGQIWEHGATEILEFIECAVNDRPFRV